MAGSIRPDRRTAIDLLLYAATLAALAFVIYRGAAAMGYGWQWYAVPVHFGRWVDGTWIWGPLPRGLLVTLQISGQALVYSILLGLFVAILRLIGTPVSRLLARVYLEAIRNTPMLIQLYLIYFVLSPILGIGRVPAAVLALTIFEGAYIAEIIRGGIVAVPKGQWEAARSLGLPGWVVYARVVLPQAVRLILPPLTGQAVSLIKHSAIVSVIAIFDLTTEGRNIIADTFMTFEIWLTVAAIYLALTGTLSALVSLLEHKLAKPYS